MAGRYASAPRMGAMSNPHHGGTALAGGGGSGAEPVYASNRSLTPSRYVTSYDPQGDGSGTGGMNHHHHQISTSGAAVAGPSPTAGSSTPSSTGLIRLSLKKPMGIVFEPMYDPNQKTVQRGVRICDLPRTGAAALSRKLQVGDELLQINDKTVSRLNFDQIMDFIIEADPECVNLLFRRPRKEILQARQGVQQKLNAALNKDNPSTVKWVDEDEVAAGGAANAAAAAAETGGGAAASGSGRKAKGKDGKKGDGKKDSKRISKRSKKSSVSEDEEETQQSSTAGDESYAKTAGRSRKKGKSRRDPYESESFLDILIDTICANSNNVCRDAFRRGDDEYFSEDDESFVTDAEDESTYVTYDESLDARGKKQRKKAAAEDETEEDTRNNDRNEGDRRKHKSQNRKDKAVTEKPEAKIQQAQPPPVDKTKKYEDDGTLESVDSAERLKQDPVAPSTTPPLGLAPHQVPEAPKSLLPALPAEPEDDVANPAPIREVEYDDRFDHGADVSVMESLGGPSLLIEKQRAAAMAAQIGVQGQRIVPAEIMDKYGHDYPVGFGLTREQTIEADPLMFYTYVVKSLLEEHEPEKVRLLDKLLAKYKGREDHLVQKLSVRYDRPADQPTPSIPEDDQMAFSDAVKKSKASSSAAAAVHTAKERMQIGEPSNSGVPEFDDPEWPEKETKEPELGDEVIEEEESSSGSEYSRDSVDGTSPAVIAQVSELLNYVYGKTSVPGQIDRVSTIMRAYEGREAVLLELLETKALIKANKEKENADNLPTFLRNSQHHMAQAQRNAEDVEANELPPVTPMATQPVTDDMSSMSGVSSPALQERSGGGGGMQGSSGIVSSSVRSRCFAVLF
jgi:PDZ domain